MGRRHSSPVRAPWAIPLREAHVASGLSVRQVAESADVCLSTATAVLQGNDRVQLRHIQSVARALGIHPRLIFDSGVPLEMSGLIQGHRFVIRVEPV